MEPNGATGEVGGGEQEPQCSGTGRAGQDGAQLCLCSAVFCMQLGAHSLPRSVAEVWAVPGWMHVRCLGLYGGKDLTSPSSALLGVLSC